ncbi:hypothetical protein C1H46_002189 [Malus baccata]|uniref:Small ribosomal subunit protein uS17c n=1 Tax=Malus baccata TaxID=106549 RepID=A0A540NML2_MALBA|nr:hypothetical protein C1H46_002189 [Malus baccata]
MTIICPTPNTVLALLLHPSPKLSTPFLLGSSTPSSPLSRPTSSLAFPTPQRLTLLPPIRALKYLQGRVVCATSDKTVAVEVTRLALHPKYKRWVRKKKKYQAHDSDNQFQVGDIVQLEKCIPISKTKTFLVVPVPAKNSKGKSGEGDVLNELGIPLESLQVYSEVYVVVLIVHFVSWAVLMRMF